MACGPEASSAIAIALTAISSGSREGSMCSRSMITEVSRIPLVLRTVERLGRGGGLPGRLWGLEEKLSGAGAEGPLSLEPCLQQLGEVE